MQSGVWQGRRNRRNHRPSSLASRVASRPSGARPVPPQHLPLIRILEEREDRRRGEGARLKKRFLLQSGFCGQARPGEGLAPTSSPQCENKARHSFVKPQNLTPSRPGTLSGIGLGVGPNGETLSSTSVGATQGDIPSATANPSRCQV